MLSDITTEIVSKVFPLTPAANISANLPAVVDALNSRNFGRCMLLVALGTIRAEAETFLPLLEMPSRFNTAPGGPPFGLYDRHPGLGNLGAPDGERFRGRGYVQLTGRANYTRFSSILNVDLLHRPELAADSRTAAAVLAEFLACKQPQIEAAVANRNLAEARKLVNGGCHGLDKFTDAFDRADSIIPRFA